MNYSITINHELKLIRYTHHGEITLEEIGTAWVDLLGLIEFNSLKYDLLTDYRDSISKLEVNDIHLICDFLLSIKDILKDKKQAFIIDTPDSTALTLLFEVEVYHKIGFVVETFSTEEAALSWLKI
jgi:hypothetical protein